MSIVLCDQLPIICPVCEIPLKQDSDHFIRCATVESVQFLERWKPDVWTVYADYLEAIFNEESVIAYYRGRHHDFQRHLKFCIEYSEKCQSDIAGDYNAKPRVTFTAVPFKAQVRMLAVGVNLRKLQFEWTDNNRTIEVCFPSPDFKLTDLNWFPDAKPLPSGGRR